MRILHLADVHLDRPFVALPPDAAVARRGELMAAFRRCLAAAHEQAVDLVTVGGDLWEEEHVMPDTRASVAYELGSVGLPVLLIAGNHDPLVPGGSYARTSWPGNVTVVDSSDPSRYEFGDIVVWALSWTGHPLSASFLDTFQVPDDGRRHLLLLHGTCQGAAWFADENGYCPFTPTQVEQAGFAACLAGHLHAASWSDRVCYPGSLEPLDWSETGRHCYALVDIEPDRVSVDLVDVNSRRYETRELGCDGAGSSAEVAARLEELVRGLDGDGLCLRMRLTGQVAPDCSLDLRELEQRAAALGPVVVVVEDRTSPAYDLQALASQRTVEGRFVAKLLAQLEQANDEREQQPIELALQLGLRAINGERELLHVD